MKTMTPNLRTATKQHAVFVGGEGKRAAEDVLKTTNALLRAGIEPSDEQWATLLHQVSKAHRKADEAAALLLEVAEAERDEALYVLEHGHPPSTRGEGVMKMRSIGGMSQPVVVYEDGTWEYNRS